jgi:hypothetical protein
VTPIATRLNDRLRARRAFFADWLASWHETKRQPGARIDLFNGREAHLAGVAFSGSSSDIFWEAIVRGLRKEVIDQLSIVEAEARSYELTTALEAVDQSVGALISFVRAIRRLTIKKDSLLRGDGINIPHELDAGHWDELSDESIAQLGETIKNSLLELAEVVNYSNKTEHI